MSTSSNYINLVVATSIWLNMFMYSYYLHSTHIPMISVKIMYHLLLTIKLSSLHLPSYLSCKKSLIIILVLVKIFEIPFIYSTYSMLKPLDYQFIQLLIISFRMTGSPLDVVDMTNYAKWLACSLLEHVH